MEKCHHNNESEEWRFIPPNFRIFEDLSPDTFGSFVRIPKDNEDNMDRSTKPPRLRIITIDVCVKNSKIGA